MTCTSHLQITGKRKYEQGSCSFCHGTADWSSSSKGKAGIKEIFTPRLILSRLTAEQQLAEHPGRNWPQNTAHKSAPSIGGVKKHSHCGPATEVLNEMRHYQFIDNHF